jgi:hypothetical protein
LLSDLPSHGGFLFTQTDKTSKEVRLLSAHEVTEHCERTKEAYKKLKTSTTNYNNNSFRLGNGKRGGNRWQGRSRNGWSNTPFRKKHYGAKKGKADDDKNKESRSSPGKKRGTGGSRGRGRDNGKKKKTSQ